MKINCIVSGSEESVSNNLPLEIQEALLREPLLSCEIANAVYCLNYARILQSNNVEVIFKKTPCPPKGTMSDFRFDYPSAAASTERRHCHFKKILVNAATRRGSLVGEGGHGQKRKYGHDGRTQAIWQPYSIIEDGAQLFFPLVR